MEKIKELYWLRFNAKERIIKNKLWRVLCRYFLQEYIDRKSTVLDLGAGSCEFINNIICKNKYAVDINEEVMKFADKDVVTFVASGVNMKEIKDNSIDVVFTSEYFEHLKNTEELLQSFAEIHRILKKEGRLIILCPNIRYLTDKYWDFIDHRLALSHVSMREGLLLYNFKMERLIKKFLPYTTKSFLPKSHILLRIYLKFPIAWEIFGRQMFIVARNAQKHP